MPQNQQDCWWSESVLNQIEDKQGSTTSISWLRETTLWGAFIGKRPKIKKKNATWKKLTAKSSHELIDFGLKGPSKLEHSILNEEVKPDPWANK